MARLSVFPNPDGTSSTWGEEVTAFDNEKMSWSYKLTSDVPFPMDKETFVCTMSVRSLGPGKCEATIGCVYDSPAPEALGFVGGMYKSWADCCAESAAKKPKTGATINILYVVPKSKADEVQAVFQKHANWMTGHYAGSTEKLISCYFTKAPLFKEPTDPSQGVTDKTIFTLNEEFTAPEMVAKHIETAKGNDYFPEFGEILGKYGVEGGVVQALGNVWFKLDAKRGGGDVIVKSEAGPIGAGAKTDGPAYSASHTGTYDVAAETMWKSLSQWNPAWLIQLGPADIKDVKGEGVGAVRTV